MAIRVLIATDASQMASRSGLRGWDGLGILVCVRTLGALVVCCMVVWSLGAAASEHLAEPPGPGELICQLFPLLCA